MYFNHESGEDSLADDLFWAWSEDWESGDEEGESGLEGVTDGALERSGHPDIGNLPGPILTDSFVIGLDVSVGSINNRGSTIEEVGHIGHLGSGFSVEVDDDRIEFFLPQIFEYPINREKRIIETFTHEDRRHNIDDQQALSIFFDDTVASPGYSVIGMREIVGRTNLDRVRVIKQILSSLEITKHMISTCEHVETKIPHRLYMLGSRSLAGGDILRVPDDEIGCVFLPQRRQVLRYHPTSRTPEYVSEYEDFHRNKIKNF